MTESSTTTQKPEPFVIIEGGIVTNNSTIPVFNMDVLDSDILDASVVENIVELSIQLRQFGEQNPEWAENIKPYLNDTYEAMRDYGEIYLDKRPTIREYILQTYGDDYLATQTAAKSLIIPSVYFYTDR